MLTLWIYEIHNFINKGMLVVSMACSIKDIGNCTEGKPSDNKTDNSLN
jgi:hypothetical protein